MIPEHFQPKSTYQALFYFFVIWFGCFLLTYFFLILLIWISFGPEAMSTVMNQGEFPPGMSLGFVKGMQITQSIGMFALPPLIFCLFDQERFRFLKLNKLPDLRLLAVVPLVIVLAYPTIIWLLHINQNMTLPDFLAPLEESLRNMESSSEAFLEQFLEMPNVSALVVNLFMMAIIPAVAEELLFRGGLQTLLTRLFKNPHVAILLAAALFSFMHMQFFGFLPRFALGVLLGYIFWWSGSLWMPILGHLIHNGAQIAMLYLYQSKVVGTDIDNMETFSPLITIGSTAALFLMIYLFARISNRYHIPEG